jgi:hypothetical protein
MLKPILESLDKERLLVFNKLEAFRDIGVLGGGTALSLQIGHRVSYDFDIFTYNKLPRDLWKKVEKALGLNCEKMLDCEDQVDLRTKKGVKVTFFYDDYKLLYKPVKNMPIDLMRLEDISTAKAYVIGKRPKWRDYVDIYFLLVGKHMDLGKIISLSKEKYKSFFAERLFLQQLVYWEDIVDYEIKFLGKPVKPDKIKRYLEREVERYRKQEI